MALTKTKHHLYFSFFISLLLAQGMFFLGIKYSLGADSLGTTEAFTIDWLGSESVGSDNGIFLQAETNREAQSLSFEIKKDDNTLSSGLLVAGSMTSINTVWSKNYYFPDSWPNGNYTIYIRAIPLGASEITNTSVVTQPFILNRITVEPLTVRWIGSTILDSNHNINLQAETSREVQGLNFMIYKTDYTVTSGSLVSNSAQDSGMVWSKVYRVPDTWPDGNYDITIEVIPLGASGGSVVITQPFVLNRTTTFEISLEGVYIKNRLENENNVMLVANTSAIAEQLSFEIKKDDLTLSSGLLRAYAADGFRKRWFFDFIFSDAWPNGNYNISIRANRLGSIASNSSVTIVEPYILNRLAIGDEFIGGDSIFTYDTQMSGTEILELKTINWSQSDFDILDVQFRVYSGTRVVAELAGIKSTFLSDNQKITANFNTSINANGTYKICASVTLTGLEKYLKCGPLVQITNTENIITKVIKLHLNEGVILKSGDKVYASSNFVNPDDLSNNPSINIKTFNINGSSLDPTPSSYIGTMSVIECGSNKIPVETRQNIIQLGHTYCWQAQVPAENLPSAFASGSGSILANYGQFLSVRTRVSFVLASSIVTNNQADSSTTTSVSQPTTESSPVDIAGNTNIQIAELEQNKETISFGINNSCSDLAVYDENICQQFLATIGNQINEQCLRAGIYNDLLCENYLLEEQVKKECTDQGVMDSQACQDLLLEKYVSTVECRLDDQALCFKTLREKYLNRLVSATNQQSRISSSTESMIGQVWALDVLSARLEEAKIDPGVLPLLANKETKVLLARSSQRTILESVEQLTILQNVVMIVDDDADGLSNDMERYFGTDINNPDSDGDTKSDGVEVASGLNPLGDGPLTQDRSNLDKIVSSGSSLEQPTKFSKNIDEQLEVTLSQNENKTVRLAGVAEANTWINIFVYSDLPLVMTTKTDASGNWTYDVQNSLVDGGHQVYVTVNDDTGNIVKQSNPVSFLVKSAQAVTAEQYFDTSNSTFVAKDGILWDYILVVAILMIVGFIFIFILYRHKKSQTEKFND